MEEGAVPGLGSQEEYQLRWNTFHTSLVSSFDDFRTDQAFVDVTLVCDGKYIKAHRIILSSSSPFFSDLLKAAPCSHPFIVLPSEVLREDLDKILQFVYRGQVTVIHERLKRFLRTATLLKIRGLVENSVQDNEDAEQAAKTSTPTECEGTSPKRPRLSLDIATPAVSVASQSNVATPTLDVIKSLYGSNNEDSTHSTNESDSEMMSVKQELVDAKSSDEFDAGENFMLKPEKLMSFVATDPQQPPPPGPLSPSYVPPPSVKPQDESGVAAGAVAAGEDDTTAHDHALGQQLRASLNAAARYGMLCAPHPLDTPPSSRGAFKRKSSGTGAYKHSPPPYTITPPLKPPPYCTSTPVYPYHHSGTSTSSAHFSAGKLSVSADSDRKTPRSANVSGSHKRAHSVSPHLTDHSVSSAAAFLRTKSLTPHKSSPDLSSGSPDENAQPNTFATPKSTSGSRNNVNSETSPTCNLCQKKFATRSNLNKHIRVQHTDEAYKCEYCQKTFTRYYIKEHTTLCSQSQHRKVTQAAAKSMKTSPPSNIPTSVANAMFSNMMVAQMNTMINSKQATEARGEVEATYPSSGRGNRRSPRRHSSGGGEDASEPKPTSLYSVPPHGYAAVSHMAAYPAATPPPYPFESKLEHDDQPTDLAIHKRDSGEHKPLA